MPKEMGPHGGLVRVLPGLSPQFDLGSQCLDQNSDVKLSTLLINIKIIWQCPLEQKVIGCRHLKLGFPWLPI